MRPHCICNVQTNLMQSSKTRDYNFGSCVWLLQSYFDMADINCAVYALNTQIITLHLTQMC